MSDAVLAPAVAVAAAASQAGSDADLFARAALESAAAALLVVDAAGVVLAFNGAAATLFGHEPDAIIGYPVSVLLADPEGGLALLIGGDPDGPAFVSSHRILSFQHSAGHLISLEVSAQQTEAEGRRAFVVVLRPAEGAGGVFDPWSDIEERLATVAANLPGIILQRVRQADGTLYYPFFSVGVRDILGYEPENMRVTRDGCLDCIHWADRDGYMQRCGDSATSLEAYVEELRVITRDGEVKWLSGTLRPERLPNGDVLWDGIYIDVTAQARAEHRLEMIMDHAADCVITVGEDRLIDSVNAAVERTFGHAVSGLIGQPVVDLLAPSERAAFSAFIDRYLATGDAAVLGEGPRELTGLRADGVPFPIELALSEVLSEGRRIFIAVVRDITKRKETETQLHETEQRLKHIASNINGIVFQRARNRDGQLAFTYVSEGVRPILGLSPDDLLADADLFTDLMDPADRATFREAMERSATALTAMEADLRLVSRQGEERWLRSWSRPRVLADGGVVWDGVALDVTDRKRAEEELMFLAYYDPLTGLGNRTLFFERFTRARGFAAGIGARIAVLSLGLDRFTMINATLGHLIGDQVLCAAARRIQEAGESGDLICRAGGDRFLMMLSGITDAADIETAAQAIQRRFEDPLQVGGEEFDLTVSIGASLFPDDGQDVESLVMHAEAALHRAKVQGPSSFQTFTKDMGARASQMLNIQHRLRRALENEEFVAFFQPQVEIRSGRICGMEALVRWISPERGLIPPGEFIEVAEEFGLIEAMCGQVLRDACRWNARWKELGLAAVPVAVNISGRQFHNSRLLMSMVEDVLREFRLDPHFLELELTESSAMSDPENAIRVVRQLKERGVPCSIDDFGTGYSSLSVLKRFPIHKLKIDRSFVNEVTTDGGDAAIVSAVIAMAGALNLKVVAEGVETQGQLDFLHGVGCDQVQGYFFSKPLPGEKMEAMFRDAKPLPRPAGL